MITSIRLQHYRSYDDASFRFESGVTIIAGPNASGKTNLLEALLVAARGSSYRARDTDLIAFGAPWARIDMRGDEMLRTVKLIREPEPDKVYEIDGRILKRLTLDHLIPAVLFEPNHLLLLSGSPDRRREYLDDLLTQTAPGYATLLRAYKRTLAQRNRLLKQPPVRGDELFPWNIRLSQLGAQIVRARNELTAKIDMKLGGLYDQLSQSTIAVTVAYDAAAEPEQYESHMLRQLDARLSTDVLRGFTSFGPHREDFSLSFSGHVASEVASRGETRTAVLCLKIIELQLLEIQRKQQPILLLDDVFSELDAARREALTEHIRTYQTFITTTDADVVADHFAAQSVIRLKAERSF
jgi:DNA replication and repair protein RecF